MKFFASFIMLLALMSCGKKIEDRATDSPKEVFKSSLSSDETWIILSERALPKEIQVVINDMTFVDECIGEGNVDIERNPNNGMISIASSSAFRQEFFDIDIYNCRDGALFYSGDYVDETKIVPPSGGALKIILRLRNR